MDDDIEGSWVSIGKENQSRIIDFRLDPKAGRYLMFKSECAISPSSACRKFIIEDLACFKEKASQRDRFKD